MQLSLEIRNLNTEDLFTTIFYYWSPLSHPYSTIPKLGVNNGFYKVDCILNCEVFLHFIRKRAKSMVFFTLNMRSRMIGCFSHNSSSSNMNITLSWMSRDMTWKPQDRNAVRVSLTTSLNGEKKLP